MFQGAGTSDCVLIEIFASRSNQQIKALTDVYLEGKRWKQPFNYSDLNEKGSLSKYSLYNCRQTDMFCLFSDQTS